MTDMAEAVARTWTCELSPSDGAPPWKAPSRRASPSAFAVKIEAKNFLVGGKSKNENESDNDHDPGVEPAARRV